MTLADTRLIENGAALVLVMLWLTQGSYRKSATHETAVGTMVTCRNALVSRSQPITGDERTFAGLGRCRRLAKDFERSIESAQAWILIANIRMLTRRLARA